MLWGREGRLDYAVQSITSSGVANKDDDMAFEELLQEHPVSDLPFCLAPMKAFLVVEESVALTCLKGFLCGTLWFVCTTPS